MSLFLWGKGFFILEILIDNFKIISFINQKLPIRLIINKEKSLLWKFKNQPKQKIIAQPLF